MENFKGTKGEWTTENCSNGGLIVCLGDTKDWGSQRVQIANEANAKLIAAAPDLLEACFKAKEGLELAGFVGSKTYNELVTAIIKATK